MIKKYGNKTDRTVMMENAIFNYFKNNYGIELEPESPVSTGIADFYKLIRNNERILDCIIVEIKQSANDFYSRHGLNFVGVSNYIAVPSELVGFAIEFLRENYGNEIGVLEVNDKGNVRTVIYPSSKYDNDYMRIINIFIPPYHLLHNYNRRIAYADYSK